MGSNESLLVVTRKRYYLNARIDTGAHPVNCRSIDQVSRGAMQKHPCIPLKSISLLGEAILFRNLRNAINWFAQFMQYSVMNIVGPAVDA